MTKTRDAFNVGPGDGPSDEAAQNDALQALKVITGLIAKRYRVCPVCLTFNMADIVASAVENGMVHHWTKDGSTDDLAEVLEEFADGTLH